MSECTDPICDDLIADYSREELVAMRKLLTTELMAPGSITEQDMEGVSWRELPKDPNEIRKLLGLIRCAIAKIDAAAAPVDPLAPPDILDAASLSHSFDFSTRRAE